MCMIKNRHKSTTKKQSEEEITTVQNMKMIRNSLSEVLSLSEFIFFSTEVRSAGLCASCR